MFRRTKAEFAKVKRTEPNPLFVSKTILRSNFAHKFTTNHA